MSTKLPEIMYDCLSNTYLTTEQFVLQDRMIHAMLLSVVSIGKFDDLNEDGCKILIDNIIKKCNEYGSLLSSIGDFCYCTQNLLENTITVMRECYHAPEHILKCLEACV